MNDIAIELINITYIYPDGTMALKDVNLKVMNGEKVVILGPNGSGKSTLFMVIAGLLKPVKGEVKIFNSGKPSFPLVGLAFQDPDDQLFCPTLIEDVAFGALNLGLTREEAVKKAEEALKAVGIEEFKNKPPHRLSIGEKKKASIATVLAMEPKILALDEPTSNLDPKSKVELINLINNLYDNNKFTLLIATHDLEFALKTVEKAYVLSKGRIVESGSINEVLSNIDLMKKIGLIA
ncbi:ABC transporter ATP-binding protein [Candidatus Bathyarchaeota archaeon]|nr:ABC transporter ATP-binding protein [Candidatus Bathyarchaeota archaeon]